MLDEDLRLAARLARAAGLVHPMDWVAVYESHSEYEWLVQKLVGMVDPWGDDRDDFRAAVNTTRLVAASGMQRWKEEDLLTLMETLRSYLRIHHPDKIRTEDTATLKATEEKMREHR